MKSESIELDKLFDFPSIKGVTEEFIRRNPGDIPVYGGKTKGNPIGYIADNLTGVKYFSNCIAWNRQGSVGYVFYHDHRFTTTDDHRPLILKSEYESHIDLQYVAIVLQDLLLSMGFSWGKTAGKGKVRTFSIDLPIDENGKVDKEKQIIMRNKKLKTRNIQEKLNEYLSLLNTHVVELELSQEVKNVSLSDEMFILEIGKRVLKKNILKAGIPVYSANVNVPFGYIEKSNLNDFESDSLLWGIDGNFDWGFIEKGTVFANTDHCGRLRVTNPSVLPEYLYYVLKTCTSSYGFDRTYRASLANIGEVTVPIPVGPNGEYDKHAQVEIINKYRKILKIRKLVISKIENITKPTID